MLQLMLNYVLTQTPEVVFQYVTELFIVCCAIFPSVLRNDDASSQQALPRPVAPAFGLLTRFVYLCMGFLFYFLLESLG